MGVGIDDGSDCLQREERGLVLFFDFGEFNALVHWPMVLSAK